MIQEHMLHVSELLKIVQAGAQNGMKGEVGTATSLWHIPDDAPIGVLPFMNGVVLGYPFVYGVSTETVNQACSWLSTTSLALFGCGFPALYPFKKLPG
jgi:hypothetical protein